MCEGPRQIADLEPDPVLDAGHARQRRRTILDILVLDEERRLPVAAVRDQGIVGGHLLFDGVGLENALDPQHFLDLVLHRQEILEQQRGMRSQGHASRLLVFDDGAPERIPFDGVPFQLQRLVRLSFSIALPGF